MIVTGITDDRVKILEEFLTILKSDANKNSFITTHDNVLTSAIWSSGNVLSYIKEIPEHLVKNFNRLLNELKLNAEHFFNRKFEYKFVHYFDYSYNNGSAMEWHDHAGQDDVVFIAYLNTLKEGETVFYSGEIKVVPHRGLIVYFEGNVAHSAAFSNNKRIIVGGFKIV